jgi:uncharacterized protein (DUF849 family)
MDPVIVQAALTGAVTTAAANPNLPTSVDEIVSAGVGAWNAGASVLHIHACEEDGAPTQRLERFRPVVDRLRQEGLGDPQPEHGLGRRQGGGEGTVRVPVTPARNGVF